MRKDGHLSSASLTRRLVPGLLLVGIAAGCSLVYLLTPIFERAWSPSGRMLFWSLQGLIAVIGVIRLCIAVLPDRRRLQISSLRRSRVFIPKEGLVYLVIMIVLFVGSLLGHTNMLMLVFAMLAGPFVINGWTTHAMLRRSQITRNVPRRVMCGELFAVELTLVNLQSWFPLWMLQARDTVAGVGEILEPMNLFITVPPGGRQTGHYTLRLRRRGEYHFGPLRLSSRFPLGLIERGQLFPTPDRVLVYPKIGRLTRSAQRQLLGSAELTSERRARSGVFHDEFHHLREYRAGDNPRAIHWRTSARRGALILREFEQNREQHLCLLIDLWQPSSGVTADDRERTEWALSLAATICLEQRRLARDSRLSLYGDGRLTLAWEGRATAASLETLLDELALIQAGPAEHTRELWDRAWHSSAISSRFVVISTRTTGREVWQREQSANLPVHIGSKLQWMFVEPADMPGWVKFDDE